MIKCRRLCIAFLSIYTSLVFSESIPKGFENLFNMSESSLKLRNLDGTMSEPIVFFTSFDRIKLDVHDVNSMINLTRYLENNEINDEYKSIIIDDFITGVRDTSNCTGVLNECVIYPDTYEIVLNYNDKEVYLFVSPNVLNIESNGIQENKLYYDAKNEHNGIINSFDLYASDYSNQNSVISFNDKLTVGMPYGYLKTDFYLNNSESGSELYEAAYHLDVDSYLLKAGYFSYDPEVNTTDFLNGNTRISQSSITFGSSKNLLMGGDNSDKLLTFYAPTSGNVYIYRNARIIHQNVVKEGVHSIPYSSLPRGRYEVLLEVKSGSGVTTTTQTYQIYNNSSDSLPVGNADFALSSGLFKTNHYDNRMKSVNDIEGDPYAKGLVNYQLWPSFNLGMGGIASKQGTMFNLGGSYSLLDWGGSSEAVFRQFEDASHMNASISVPFLSLAYEQLNNQNRDLLASYMYGYADFSRVSLNTTYSFGHGQSIYAIYSINDDKLLDAIGTFTDQQYQLLSIGYTTPALLDSRLNVNLDVTDVRDEMSLSILWSIPLSTTIEAILGETSNTRGVAYLKTTLRKSNVIDSDSVATSLEVSNTYDRGINTIYQSMLASANGNTSYARGNISAHASTNGYYGINLGLSSTQVVANGDIYFTDKSSAAYAIVDVSIDHGLSNGQEIDEKGYFTLKKGGKRNRQFIVYDDQTIMPVEAYNEYKASFDSKSVDLYSTGTKQLDVYAQPGTVMSLSPKVSRTVSFISAFKNIAEKPVFGIECEGEGCIEVNKMSDGVYRVTVIEGLDFALTSKNTRCLLPYEFHSTNLMNFGQNYCLSIFDRSEPLLVDIDGRNLEVLFLGVYQESLALNSNIKLFESLGYQVIQKDIGQQKAIYIAQSPNDVKDSFNQHRKEISEIKRLAQKHYYTDSVEYYPITKTKNGD
ncbi:hypothetical protein A1QO_09955 [Vibrio genomosp. F10 str. ZF-129]|uniref:Pilus assembly protein E-set like domain-containing protein n=1 Tax=Vibrio genomosp. F10 str. ZF-129 TaxID=1187848 RepID=A0A1E5BDM9_9VIBR|nr:CS1-pili formation C-terminal domain-containing protein [Vibrio genomosp. F10]OEE33267.1 hypothetical protein A1QO_09955 [Vibrio genomosp. F10 str. ZF-129]